MNGFLTPPLRTHRPVSRMRDTDAGDDVRTPQLQYAGGYHGWRIGWLACHRETALPPHSRYDLRGLERVDFQGKSPRPNNYLSISYCKGSEVLFIARRT